MTTTIPASGMETETIGMGINIKIMIIDSSCDNHSWDTAHHRICHQIHHHVIIIIIIMGLQAQLVQAQEAITMGNLEVNGFDKNE